MNGLGAPAAALRIPLLALLLVAVSALAAAADVFYQVENGVFFLSNYQKTEQFQSVTIDAAAAPAGVGGAAAAAPQLSFQPTAFESVLARYCTMYGVDINLVKAVMMAESGMEHADDAGNVKTSVKGAVGIMQVMPATGASMGFHNLSDIDENIHAGVKYLSMMLRRFNNDIVMAVAAYNAGPEAVAKYNGIPPYAETKNYVTTVLGYYQSGVTAAAPAMPGYAPAGFRPLRQFADPRGNVVLTNIY